MTLSWKRKRLEVRAAVSAQKPTQARWPRRWVFFGPRVVTLQTFLLSEARANRNYQKDLNRLRAVIVRLEAGVANRNASLGKAHDFIQDLKREAGRPNDGAA